MVKIWVSGLPHMFLVLVIHGSQSAKRCFNDVIQEPVFQCPDRWTKGRAPIGHCEVLRDIVTFVGVPSRFSRSPFGMVWFRSEEVVVKIWASVTLDVEGSWICSTCTCRAMNVNAKACANRLEILFGFFVRTLLLPQRAPYFIFTCAAGM